MDVLADLLARARARGALFSHLDLAPPWGVGFGGARPLTLHALLPGQAGRAGPVGSGVAWLEMAGSAPVQLEPGILVLAQAGPPYRIVHAPGAIAIPIAEARVRGSAPPPTAADRALAGGALLGGALLDGALLNGAPLDGALADRALLLCGAYTLEGTVCDGLLAALPRFVIVPASEQSPQLVAAVHLLSAEIEQEAAGQQTVLDRLLDLILVYLVRAWFARPESSPPGWYHALDDPVLGPVLRAIHADPARRWSVATMAEVAGVSRAAFARRFAGQVATTPLAYLTDLRMQLAEAALLRPGVTLAAVAEQVGYGSEFAFSDAFKRQHAITPGRWRRHRRDLLDEPVVPL